MSFNWNVTSRLRRRKKKELSEVILLFIPNAIEKNV